MSELPDRYTIGMQDRPDLSLTPLKAIQRADLGPDGNRLFMIRGLQRYPEDLQQEDHPAHRIYLDGACQGPYFDAHKSLYSLDHHERCYRQITDATCIQALKLARKGVIRAVGNDIVGNDPDLDTVLAAWATLNADILAHDERVYQRAHPLFALEGNIDAYGLGYEDLTLLPQEAITLNRNRIQWLMEDERAMKGRGRWNTADYIDYLDEKALRKVDQYMLYQDSVDKPITFEDRESIALENGQTIELAVAKHAGIYEAERSIVQHEQKSETACVVFTDGDAKITLKLYGIVNPFHLQSVWPALNELEQEWRMQKRKIGTEYNNAKWGGSDTIGGPPRYQTGEGSMIPMQKILEALQESLNAQLEETAVSSGAES